MADMQKINHFAHGFRTFCGGWTAFNWIMVMEHIKKIDYFVKFIIF